MTDTSLAAPQTLDAAADCFHCGLPIPPGTDYRALIQGQPRSMCCPGCQAVAETIAASGLENYYKHRAGPAGSPEIKTRELKSGFLDELTLYDSPELQQGFVSAIENHREASLVIEGITCAACVWLLEHHLSKMDGVLEVRVNLTNHRARISWQPEQQKLSHIFAEIYCIGYQAHPYQPDLEEQRLALEQKKALRRLGVAGIGMMQTMMLAIALYGGALQGMETQYESFMRWVSLVFATPVILYSAQSFFIAALRDFKTRHLTMDVPVSIAIGGAYLASVWATVTNSGEVYFDSVTMFTLFLLTGRFLEMKARHRSGRAGNALLNLIPNSAIQILDGKEQLIPASELKAGMEILVKPGQTIPADAEIIAGRSSVDESALTGEYLPIAKQTGDAVVGGTMNVENPLTLRITRTGNDTQLSAIVRLLERAQAEKPAVAKIADKVASYFVAIVLLTATVVSISWWQIEPANAFWITLSVLVVTCPCALSLATPTALTAATATLREHGLLITRGHVLEALANADEVVFDKTGTLTEGRLTLQQVIPLGDTSEQQCIQLAAALEKHSEHPIAHAFQDNREQLSARDIEASLGLGLQGKIDQTLYRIGKPEYAMTLCPDATLTTPTQSGLWLLLCSAAGPQAWFRLNDHLRPEAASAIAQLKRLGLNCHLLTGDSSSAVTDTVTKLGINHCMSGASPEQKLQYVNQLQAEGKRVIMVGDGINDIPVLAGSQTSIAMGSATDLAKTSADAVLVNHDLTRLASGIQLARKSRRIINQNLAWSLCYNLTALPLAAFGFIAPYMAALGMSLSSLVVVGNALRLSSMPKNRAAETTKIR
ncbi:heavy metal translocating P-type ATPase [Neptuniibacter sp. CAU 1671]|uniref:heavy metal translocating P-type ATPase n=1 Tax=Neptuniibacter sp. CAU 1671 TaxID=3032593 RepID=UPI0023DACDE8|nr:heavy metal translocating P-type ATPase [Neptuniibacter sp. CAU 1671]MDF2182890.1 heavy metal translocating P-type ATPase [Neptuniibacter sp. CAU 1671]